MGGGLPGPHVKKVTAPTQRGTVPTEMLSFPSSSQGCDPILLSILYTLSPFLFSKEGKSILIMKHFQGRLGLPSAGLFVSPPSQPLPEWRQQHYLFITGEGVLTKKGHKALQGQTPCSPGHDRGPV